MNLFEIGFRTSEHRRLLNIDKYNVVNDYCQYKFTNIQAEIISVRKKHSYTDTTNKWT